MGVADSNTSLYSGKLKRTFMINPAERTKEWRRCNPDKYARMLERERIRKKTGSEKQRDRAYYLLHREKRIAYTREYIKKHRAELSQKALVKYHSDPITNLRTRIMSRLSETITTKNPKRNKWLDVLGYSINELKSHIERLFTVGMSWENYGEWHIDHKIPVSAFNFSLVEDIDFKRCWSLKNLRPLWARDNLRKSARLDRPFQPSFLIS